MRKSEAACTRDMIRSYSVLCVSVSASRLLLRIVLLATHVE